MVKAKLQRQFGLYPRGSTDPFGPEHFVGFNLDAYEVRMLRGDGYSRSEADEGGP